MVSIFLTLMLSFNATAEVAKTISYNASETDGWQFEQRQIIDRLTNTTIKSFAPNCWNSALMVSGFTNSIRYTSDAEFWHWMNSSYCEALPQNASLRYGDIGSVYNWKRDHFHSFMRINDNLLFQKGSPRVDKTWGTFQYESILHPEFYEEANRCKGNEATMIRNNCDFRVVYHRCRPAPDNFYSQYQELSTIDVELKLIEDRMQIWMTNHSPELREQFYQDLIRLSKLLNQVDSKRYSGEKEFARKALAFRIAGNIFIDIDQENEPQNVDQARIYASNFLNRFSRTNDIPESYRGPR